LLGAPALRKFAEDESISAGAATHRLGAEEEVFNFFGFCEPLLSPKAPAKSDFGGLIEALSNSSADLPLSYEIQGDFSMVSVTVTEKEEEEEESSEEEIPKKRQAPAPGQAGRVPPQKKPRKEEKKEEKSEISSDILASDFDFAPLPRAETQHFEDENLSPVQRFKKPYVNPRLPKVWAPVAPRNRQPKKFSGAFDQHHADLLLMLFHQLGQNAHHKPLAFNQATWMYLLEQAEWFEAYYVPRLEQNYGVMRIGSKGQTLAMIVQQFMARLRAATAYDVNNDPRPNPPSAGRMLKIKKIVRQIERNLFLLL
jgi:hypothetical protein